MIDLSEAHRLMSDLESDQILDRINQQLGEPYRFIYQCRNDKAALGYLFWPILCRSCYRTARKVGVRIIGGRDSEPCDKCRRAGIWNPEMDENWKLPDKVRPDRSFRYEPGDVPQS